MWSQFSRMAQRLTYLLALTIVPSMWIHSATMHTRSQLDFSLIDDKVRTRVQQRCSANIPWRVRSLRRWAFVNLFSDLFEGSSPDVSDTLSHRSIWELRVDSCRYSSATRCNVRVISETWPMVERRTGKSLEQRKEQCHGRPKAICFTHQLPSML